MAFTNNNTLSGFGLFSSDLINNGVVDVFGGLREIDGTLSSTALNGGTILIEATGTAQLDKAASGNSVTFKASTGTLEILQLASIASTLKITNIQTGDVILLPNAPAGFGLNYNTNTGTLAITNGGSTLGDLVFTPAASLTTSFFKNEVLQCFAAGTRIATPEGPRAVETLREGDLVRTRNNEARTIEWAGKRRVDCARHPAPAKVLPFRIAAHAFGHDAPCRDLLLSPDHAIFAADVLIPVKYLDNGTTIRQVNVPEVTYYHFELAEHEIVEAEGLTVETLLPGGDKTGFASGSAVTTLWPEFAPWNREARGCAPLALTGAALVTVRQLINRRAALHASWPIGHDCRAVPKPASRK
jgi:hypothetical protein